MEHFVQEVFISKRELDNTTDNEYSFDYSDYSLCGETDQDYIVACIGIPCIVFGFLMTIFFFISSSCHRSILLPTDIFINSYVVANSLNFITTSSSVVEFMIRECWNASIFACKFSVWSSEFTATSAVGFLSLVVIDAYHPWIHRFMLPATRRYIAIIVVFVLSVLITTPEFFLVGVKEIMGNRLCVFTSNIPGHYMLVLKKDLFMEYVLPILLTSFIVMHGQWILSRNALNPKENSISTRGASNEHRDSIAVSDRNRLAGTDEGRPRQNRHALVLALAFLLLKMPHNIIIFVDVFEVYLPSIQFRVLLDYFELSACLIYAGIAPLLVLVSSQRHREKSKQTLQILKSLVSGRPWQQGFEMHLRNDSQA